jgi:hypothetical protein
MTINILIFEKLLAKENITKIYFAKYADIPYYTVTGWKKNKKVPRYAMVILKDIIYRKKLDLQANAELKKRNHTLEKLNIFNISPKEVKQIESIFWGTNYCVNEILIGIQEHNPIFETRFKENTMKSFRQRIYKQIQVAHSA